MEKKTNLCIQITDWVNLRQIRSLWTLNFLTCEMGLLPHPSRCQAWLDLTGNLRVQGSWDWPAPTLSLFTLLFLLLPPHALCPLSLLDLPRALFPPALSGLVFNPWQPRCQLCPGIQVPVGSSSPCRDPRIFVHSWRWSGERAAPCSPSSCLALLGGHLQDSSV